MSERRGHLRKAISEEVSKGKELDIKNEEDYFRRETRALDWQVEEEEDLIKLYEKQRETKPEGPLDSYLYKNTLTEERYEQLKERVRRARERKAQIQKEGLGEVKGYFRA